MPRLFPVLTVLALILAVLMSACDAEGQLDFTVSPEVQQAVATAVAQEDLTALERVASTLAPLPTPSVSDLETATPAAEPEAVAAPEATAAPAVAPPPGSPETDREALVTLYNATDGPNWWINENWLSDAPIGQWYGVTADGNGRVTELRLRRNDLGGALPPELGNLTHLRVLDLHDNSNFRKWPELNWRIPPELGHLANLEVLDLGSNYLDEGIPPQLGNLANLRVLNLGSHIMKWTEDKNIFWKIPPQLGNLAKLEEVDIRYHGKYSDGQGLTGELPPEWASLPNLKKLWISDNSLEGCLPASLRGKVVRYSDPLEDYYDAMKFCVTADPRTSVETDRAALTALYHATNGDAWDTSKTWLTILPLDTWTGVTTGDNGRVVGLWLESGVGGGVLLTGELPPELGNLPYLEWLSLNSHQLTGGIPPELGNLPYLEWLSLNNNQLTGEIPPELGNLTSLIMLSPNQNQFTGQIPPELGNLTKLEWLIATRNQLTGEIPPELGNLVYLTNLALEWNQLTGIPPEFGNLRNLATANLGANELTKIPPELGNLDNLINLDLSWDQLTEISPELGNLDNLTSLNLYKTHLTEIPPELANLPRLKYLDLRDSENLRCFPSSFRGHRSLSDFKIGRLQYCSP